MNNRTYIYSGWLKSLDDPYKIKIILGNSVLAQSYEGRVWGWKFDSKGFRFYVNFDLWNPDIDKYPEFVTCNLEGIPKNFMHLQDDEYDRFMFRIERKLFFKKQVLCQNHLYFNIDFSTTFSKVDLADSLDLKNDDGIARRDIWLMRF